MTLQFVLGFLSGLTAALGVFVILLRWLVKRKFLSLSSRPCSVVVLEAFPRPFVRRCMLTHEHRGPCIGVDGNAITTRELSLAEREMNAAHPMHMGALGNEHRGLVQ